MYEWDCEVKVEAQVRTVKQENQKHNAKGTKCDVSASWMSRTDSFT